MALMPWRKATSWPEGPRSPLVAAYRRPHTWSNPSKIILMRSLVVAIAISGLESQSSRSFAMLVMGLVMTSCCRGMVCKKFTAALVGSLRLGPKVRWR